jgi:hypothetical protein
LLGHEHFEPGVAQFLLDELFSYRGGHTLFITNPATTAHHARPHPGVL